MKLREVQEIASELFDGDGARFDELISAFKEKDGRVKELETLLLEMLEKRPGGVYFASWKGKIEALGITSKD